MTYSQDLLELINPHLDHNATEIEIVESEVREIYERLMARVNASLNNSSRNGAAAQHTTDRLTQLAHELHRLCEVVRLSDVLHQHSAGKIRCLEVASGKQQHQSAISASQNGQQFGELRRDLNHLEHSLGQAFATIESYRSQLEALQNVLPLRMFAQSGRASSGHGS